MNPEEVERLTKPECTRGRFPGGYCQGMRNLIVILWIAPGSGIGGEDGDFDLRRVFAALVERCDRLVGNNEELKAENEGLRDEIRRLKGLPPRPKFKPKPSACDRR